MSPRDCVSREEYEELLNDLADLRLMVIRLKEALDDSDQRLQSLERQKRRRPAATRWAS